LLLAINHQKSDKSSSLIIKSGFQLSDSGSSAREARQQSTMGKKNW